VPFHVRGLLAKFAERGLRLCSLPKKDELP
jgi:hypothetical protein